jgi:uncharacterized protein (UPF0332 family)
MTMDEARYRLSRQWWDAAEEALGLARSAFAEERLRGALNRAYYAVFHAASAVFVAAGRDFTKHTGLQAAVHRDLVHAGLLAVEWGQAYDRLYDSRGQGDYTADFAFTRDTVGELVASAEGLVAQLRDIELPPGEPA